MILSEGYGCYLVVHLYPGLEHLFGPLYIEQDIGEGSDSVLITSHHHIGKPNIVERGDLTGWHTGVHVLKC